MTRFAAILLPVLLAACPPRPALRVDSLAQESITMMWCASALNGKGEPLLGCSTERATCSAARAKAIEWGGWANVSEIGLCSWIEIGAAE